MLAMSKRNQRATALLAFAAGLMTIAPSATAILVSSTPQPAAIAPSLAATSAAPASMSGAASGGLTLVSTSRRPAPGDLPTTLQTIADANANMQRQQDTHLQQQQQMKVLRQQQQQPGQPQARQAPVSQVVATSGGERIQWPMVDVDKQRNKSTVDVHVPIFFDMVNQNDVESGKSKLDLSVLQGLVTVNRDKARDQNGQLTGPLKVTVFGIPVYSSKGLAPPPPAPPSIVVPSATMPLVAQSRLAAKRDLDNTLAQVNQTLSKKAEDIVARVTENTKRTNDQMLHSLSDIFERFSSMMRATSSRAASISQPPPPLTPPQQQREENRVQQDQKMQEQQQQQQQQLQKSSRSQEKKSENQLAAEHDFARTNSNKPPGERMSYDFRS